MNVLRGTVCGLLKKLCGFGKKHCDGMGLRWDIHGTANVINMGLACGNCEEP